MCCTFQGNAGRCLALLAVTAFFSGCGISAADPTAAEVSRLPDSSASAAQVQAFLQTGVVVLESRSAWRSFTVLGPPVIKEGSVRKTASFGVAWLDAPSSPPPVRWQDPDFDDSSWLRAPVSRLPNTPMVRRLCVRGSFTVTDPSVVQGLTVLARYHGGVMVSVNGTAAGYAHLKPLPDGTVEGEPYPQDAFIDEAGKPVVPFTPQGETAPPELQRRRNLWTRYALVRVPSELLRKGRNVVAVEVIAAPQDSILSTIPDRAFAVDFFGPTCYLGALGVRAQSGAGLSLCPGRPQGMFVWNADILESSADADIPNVAEPLRPVRIVGPANGLFSGKVHVGSTEPISALAASISDLSGPAGFIPASACSIRYGIVWGNDNAYYGWDTTWSPRPFYGGAARKPLPVYPVSKNIEFPGVVVPIWVSVKIPKGAKAGEYGGVLKVSTSGRSVEVPVEVKVVGWELPDADEYRTWVELVQSPDTLAVEYGVPLWSERHWEMIGRSFELIRPTGSRVVYIPAISHTNLGNEESMIRWVKDEAGGYRWDFSVMERYLDVAEERLGKPKVVVLQVWEVYMREGGQKRFEDFKFMGQPQVTEYDPRSGETRNVALPSLRDGASRQMWGGLIEEVRQRLRRRGLEKALMLGMFCDMVPTREDVEFFRSIAPDLGWVQQGHGFMTKLHGIADVGYNASVWGGLGFADGCRQTNQSSKPFTSSAYGWARPTLNAVYERNTGLDSYPPTRWYFFPLTGVTGEFRGIGRIGADMWKAVRNREGKRAATVPERFPEGYWGGTSISLTICNPVLCPGQDGPEATARLMALIEGVELSEARIVVEEAVKEGKVSGEAKARCEEFLQTQLFNMWRALSNHQVRKMWGGATGWRWVPGIAGTHWFLGSNWQEQAETLYTLAGEVTRMSRR